MRGHFSSSCTKDECHKGQRLSYLAPGHVGDVDGGIVGLGDPLAPDEQGGWAPHLPWPQPLLLQGVIEYHL